MVDLQKSAVTQLWEQKLLEFSFTPSGSSRRRPASKEAVRFKKRVRELTRARGVSMERIAEDLARYLRAGSAISFGAKHRM